MSKSERVEYLGDDVVVTWEGDLCIHVGECGRAQGDLFVREDLAIDGAPEDVPGLKFGRRCAASKNKPFCCGTHEAIGFKG